MVNDFLKQFPVDHLFEHNIGLELETHRINQKTKRFSTTPHSSRLGDRKIQSHFQTDFSESQEELITDVFKSDEEAMRQLFMEEAILSRELVSEEILWQYSLPPLMNQQTSQWLISTFERDWYAKYREYLIQKYGIEQHVQTGVHLNFSFSDQFISDYQHFFNLEGKIAAKQKVYFQLAKNLDKFQFLLVYLFGNTPVSWKNNQIIRSHRQASWGFHNQFDEQINYSNFDEFMDRFQALLDQKKYYAPNEFYGNFRFKAKNNTPSHLKENGPEYIEIRLLDNNPLEVVGVGEIEISTIELLVFHSLFFPTKSNIDTVQNWHVVAEQRPTDKLPSGLQNDAEQLLQQLKKILPLLPKNELFKETISYIDQSIKNPKLTNAAKIIEKFSVNDFDNQLLNQFKINKQQMISINLQEIMSDKNEQEIKEYIEQLKKE